MTTLTSELPQPVETNPRLAVRDFSMILALLAIWGFFGVMDRQFLGARNLSNLTVELSITAVLALGMLLILLTGQIDLSIGSGVGLTGGIAAVLIFEHNWPGWAAALAPTLAALVIWLGLGTLIVRERVPAFIATLAGMLVFKGLHWKVIHNATIPIVVGDQPNLISILTTYFLPHWAGFVLVAVVVAAMTFAAVRARARRQSLGLAVPAAEMMILKLLVTAQMLLLFVLVCHRFRGIPLSAVILMVAAVVVWVLTQHTRFGRYLYAIGGNEEAARMSGVPVMAVMIATYGIMGLLTALGGFMQTAYAGASTTTIGNLQELDAVAACVIGGTSLRGGRGSVTGVIFGALIMASLLNGMTLMAVSPEIKYIARGGVLALAVWMDQKLASRTG
jgi:D-xylose transport system permease protein